MAIGLPVIFMMAILGLEIGLLYRTAGQAKTAADAAALAAAARIPQGIQAATDGALEIVAEHDGPNGAIQLLVSPDNGPSSEVQFGRWNPQTKTFLATLENPNAVRTTINLNPDHPNGAVPVFLGSLFNLPYASMRRASIAQVRIESAEPMLLTQSTMGNGAFDLRDNAVVTVQNASVDIASSASAAARFAQNARIECVELCVAGDLEILGNPIIEAVVFTGIEPAEDPFDGIAPPSSEGQPTRAEVPETTGQVNIQPGIHDAGFTYSQGTYTLGPGLYFVGDDGVHLQGTAQLIGTDARIILQGSNAAIQLSGNAALTLSKTPPFPAQGHMTLIGMGSAQEWAITDNASLHLAGAAYAPEVSLNMRNGQWVSNALIINDLHLEENATMDITGNGRIGSASPRSRAVLVK